MIFYLVRHGESLPRDGLGHLQGKGVGLSSFGKAQARVLAGFLQSAKIDHIVTSPARRAKETALIIREKCDVLLGEDARLGEHVVSLNSTDKNLVRDLRKRVRENQDFIPYEGESFLQGVSRFRDALREIASTHKGNVVVVTHREILQNFLLDQFSLPSAPPIHEASYSTIEYREGLFRLISFNTVPFSLRVFLMKAARRLENFVLRKAVI